MNKQIWIKHSGAIRLWLEENDAGAMGEVIRVNLVLAIVPNPMKIETVFGRQQGLCAKPYPTVHLEVSMDE